MKYINGVQKPLASEVINTPAGNIAAADVQTAVNELDTEKLPLAGGTMTGVLTQNGANLAGTAYKSQSFQNLIKNGDFESWSAGAAAAPDGWVLTGAGATVARDGTNKYYNSYGAALTRGGADLNLRSTPTFSSAYQGKTLTAGVWIKATVASRARVSIDDGVSTSYSSYHTGGGAWEFITVSKIFDAAATAIYTDLRVDTGDTTAYFDGAILVEGSVVPAFSPKPLEDDGKTLTVDSANNRVGINDTSPAEALDVTGNALISGNVGIGVTSASQILVIKPSSENNGLVVREADDGNNAVNLYSNNVGGYAQFLSGGSVLTQINGLTNGDSYFFTGGNVGIGTSSPRAKLDIATGYLVGTGLQLPHVVNKTASANVRNSYDAEATTQSTGYVKLKTITLTNGLVGQQRFLFDLKTSNVANTANARLYRNGVALGIEQSDVTGGYVTKSEDITQTWAPGDTAELWAKIDNALEIAYVRNFRIAYDDSPTVAVASANS